MTKKSVKKNKSKEKRRIMLLLFTVVVLIIALVGTVFSDWSMVVSNKKETAELENRYKELLEEEVSLNGEVVKLQDPNYIARYAREKYLYSKNGETILRIVDNKDNTSIEEDKGSEEN